MGGVDDIIKEMNGRLVEIECVIEDIAETKVAFFTLIDEQRVLYFGVVKKNGTTLMKELDRGYIHALNEAGVEIAFDETLTVPVYPHEYETRPYGILARRYIVNAIDLTKPHEDLPPGLQFSESPSDISEWFDATGMWDQLLVAVNEMGCACIVEKDHAERIMAQIKKLSDAKIKADTPEVQDPAEKDDFEVKEEGKNVTLRMNVGDESKQVVFNLYYCTYKPSKN